MVYAGVKDVQYTEIKAPLSIDILPVPRVQKQWLFSHYRTDSQRTDILCSLSISDRKYVSSFLCVDDAYITAFLWETW